MYLGAELVDSILVCISPYHRLISFSPDVIELDRTLYGDNPKAATPCRASRSCTRSEVVVAQG